MHKYTNQVESPAESKNKLINEKKKKIIYHFYSLCNFCKIIAKPKENGKLTKVKIWSKCQRDNHH